MARARSRTALLGWLTALVAGITAFHGLGATLPAPPLQPAAFGDWLAATEPTQATMSLLRLFVLALSWYLVGVTAVGVVARVAGAARLVGIADVLTVPAVRRLLQSTLGLGLATAMVAAATPARAQPLPLQLLEQADTPETVRSTAPATPGPPRAATAEPPGPALAGPAEAAETTEPLGVADDADVPAPCIGHHVVVAGESFWRIAADRVTAHEGRRASDAEVAVYWRHLIEQNRSRLADPANPDLLFPGQRLELPPLTG